MIFKAIFILIVFALLGGVGFLIRRGKPVYLTEKDGRISPDRWSAGLVVLVGVGLAVYYLYAFIQGMSSGTPVANALNLAGVLGGGLMALWMLPSLTSLQDLSWDHWGVHGIGHKIGPVLGWRKERIGWHEISRRGETVTRHRYLETSDGRRIYWSHLYSGYGHFEKRLKSKLRS